MKSLHICAWVVTLPLLSATARAEAPPVAVTAAAPPVATAEAPPADPNAEPAIAATGPEGDYLRSVHHHVHRRWADNFLRLAQTLPVSDPINVNSRSAEAEVIIGGDGRIVSIRLLTPSGYAGFDDAINEVLRDSAPLPAPPVDLQSDDESAHIRWVFARDQRRCSGMTLERMQDPLEIAAPKLLRKHREGELFIRAAAAAAAGVPVESIMGAIAKAWMPATLATPNATVAVARVLAEAGDAAAIKWLQTAVTRPQTAEAAGEAMASAKLRICHLVKKSFDSPNLADQLQAALVLKHAGEAECAPGLIRLLENPKARPEARAAAATALGSIAGDDTTRKALVAAAKDDYPTAVRGAAMLAGIRPGAGRPKIVAMVPFLRDPVPDIRAAAAGGIIRAGGDADLADLYVLFKDDNPRAAEYVARELDRVRTEEATKFLVRLLKRPHPSVNILAARMLIKRRALSSYPSLKSFLDPSADAELRSLALVAADPEALRAAGNAADPRQAVGAYRAYLGRGERDLAGGWWIAHAPTLTPPAQVETLLDWINSRDPRAAMARETRAEK